MSMLKTTQLTRVAYTADGGDNLEFIIDGSTGCEVRITSADSRLSVVLSAAEVADLVSTLSQNVLQRR